MPRSLSRRQPDQPAGFANISTPKYHLAQSALQDSQKLNPIVSNPQPALSSCACPLLPAPTDENLPRCEKYGLEIAESLADAEYQLRSLWGLWLYHLTPGKYRAALGFAQQFHALARTPP